MEDYWQQVDGFLCSPELIEFMKLYKCSELPIFECRRVLQKLSALHQEGDRINQKKYEMLSKGDEELFNTKIMGGASLAAGLCIAVAARNPSVPILAGVAGAAIEGVQYVRKEKLNEEWHKQLDVEDFDKRLQTIRKLRNEMKGRLEAAEAVGKSKL